MHRDMHAVRGIERAGPSGDESNSGGARELPVGLGHHRDGALVAANDILDSASVKRIEHRQEAFAGQREHPPDSELQQLLHKYSAAGSLVHRIPFQRSAHPLNAFLEAPRIVNLPRLSDRTGNVGLSAVSGMVGLSSAGGNRHARVDRQNQDVRGPA